MDCALLSYKAAWGQNMPLRSTPFGESKVPPAVLAHPRRYASPSAGPILSALPPHSAPHFGAQFYQNAVESLEMRLQ